MKRGDINATVSIIIPTKDRQALLRQTLASIQAQTYASWEAIVVDDGSTDATREMVTTLAGREPRLRYVERASPHSGANVCRNQGFTASTGDCIIFLDSDDVLAPFCLEQRVAVLEANPELEFAVFPCQLFKNMPGDRALLWNADTGEDDLNRFLKRDVPWQTTSPIWRREALVRLGPWDESLLSWQDWEFHVRALVSGLHYRRFPYPDCFWRLPGKAAGSAGSTGRKSVSREHLLSHERLLEKVQRMLEEAGLLDAQRRLLLVGLYFMLAEQWTSRGTRRKAAAVWRACREKGLSEATVYQEGLLYFKVEGVRAGRRVLRRYLRARWPEEYFGRKSSTLRKAPLPAELHPSEASVGMKATT